MPSSCKFLQKKRGDDYFVLILMRFHLFPLFLSSVNGQLFHFSLSNFKYFYTLNFQRFFLFWLVSEGLRVQFFFYKTTRGTTHDTTSQDAHDKQTRFLFLFRQVFLEGQNGAKTSPRRSKTRQDVPRCAKMRPTGPQEGPRHLQDAPDAPKTPQDSENGSKIEGIVHMKTKSF